MGEICIESGACFPTFAAAMVAQPGGGRLHVESGDYFEAVTFAAPYTIDKVDPSAFRPVLMHSPGLGAPILSVSGPGVAVTVVGLDFDGSDGRVFEVSDGAAFTLQGAFITSTAIRSYGAVGTATDASVTLQVVEIVGGAAAVGGQLYFEDSSLSANSLALTGGRGIATGVIDLIDTDNVAEEHTFDVLAIRDADVAFGQHALKVRGDSVTCNNCLFERMAGAIRIDDGELDLRNARFSNIDGSAVSAREGGTVNIVDSAFDDIGDVGVSGQNVDAVAVSLTSFARVRMGARMTQVPSVRLVGDLFCAFGTLTEDYGVEIGADSGDVLVANNRFIGGKGLAAVRLYTMSGTADWGI